MSDTLRIMWSGTVRALPLRDQLRAAAIARCEALSVTPADYLQWLGHGISTSDMLSMAADAGVMITRLDPFMQWVDRWPPDLPGENFPTDPIAFNADDFFRIAAALEVRSCTVWSRFRSGRYAVSELIEAFGTRCQRTQREGLRCDLDFIPVFGIRYLRTAWHIVDAVDAPHSGIMLDLWQYMRGGRDDKLLLSILGDKITGVQLCDATAAVPDGISLVFDGLNNRLAPVTVTFPLPKSLTSCARSAALTGSGWRSSPQSSIAFPLR